jgi:hypothetical protein
MSQLYVANPMFCGFLGGGENVGVAEDTFVPANILPIKY